MNMEVNDRQNMNYIQCNENLFQLDYQPNKTLKKSKFNETKIQYLQTLIQI